MKSQITSPILLIAFNRPDTTRIVFDKIRQVKPQNLYVAVDGPRNNKDGEDTLINEVCEIVQKVDWDCEAKYLIRENNLGCKHGVSSAISWALKDEDRVIIIEDDVVAVPAFFNYAEELLEKYKDDHRIAMISANNYTPIRTIDSDYLFTKYGHIWGWATWKRVWDKFDIELPYLKNDIENEYLYTTDISKNEAQYFHKYATNILNLMEDNAINAWGPQFAYYRIRNNLLSIIPKVNLASNIGVISSRSNNKKKNIYWSANDKFTLSVHPPKVECNIEYDKYHFKKHINMRRNIVQRIIRKSIESINKIIS